MWTDEELTVLLAIFVWRGFNEGDDSHPTNHRIAQAFGRTQPAVDRQWRNIRHHLWRLDLYNVQDNVGQNVLNIVDQYRADLPALRQQATQLINQHWPTLQGLI